jgi:hypothetical protein
LLGRDATGSTPSLDKGEDIKKIDALIRWIAPEDPMFEIQRLLELSAWLVEIEWPGIKRMVYRLREVGEMSGKEFTATWREVRPDTAIRTRRSMQCDYPPPTVDD